MALIKSVLEAGERFSTLPRPDDPRLFLAEVDTIRPASVAADVPLPRSGAFALSNRIGDAGAAEPGWDAAAMEAWSLADGRSLSVFAAPLLGLPSGPDGQDPNAATPPIGYAAGRTLEEALPFAVIECVERAAVEQWWRIRPRTLGFLASATLPEEANELGKWLNERAAETRVFLQPTLAGIIVAVAASRRDRDGRLAIGSGAGTDPAGAALSAVHELIQTEVSLALNERVLAAGASGELEGKTERLRHWAHCSPVEDLAFLFDGDPLEAPDFSSASMLAVSVDTIEAALGGALIGVDLTVPDLGLPVAAVFMAGPCRTLLAR